MQDNPMFKVQNRLLSGFLEQTANVNKSGVGGEVLRVLSFQT